MTTQSDPNAGKSLVYYQQMVDAWFTCGIEQDRTTIALASGGIALATTQIGPGNNIAASACGACAAVFFVIALVLALASFELGKRNIERQIQNEHEPNCTVVDRTSWTGNVLVVTGAAMLVVAKILSL